MYIYIFVFFKCMSKDTRIHRQDWQRIAARGEFRQQVSERLVGGRNERVTKERDERKTTTPVFKHWDFFWGAAAPGTTRSGGEPISRCICFIFFELSCYWSTSPERYLGFVS